MQASSWYAPCVGVVRVRVRVDRVDRVNRASRVDDRVRVRVHYP